MSQKDLELGFRTVGVFWDYTTFIHVRTSLQKEYPDKKYRKRFELIEVLDESKVPVIPTIITIGAFRCQKCGTITKVDQCGSPVLKAPLKCQKCGTKSFGLDVKSSEFYTPARRDRGIARQ